MLKVGRVILVLLALLFVSACNQLPTTQSPVVISSPSIEIVPQPSISSPIPAPLTPTDTSVPPPPTRLPVPLTPTHTPAPTGLNPTGPYLIFKAHSGIWITNPDGSFPTRLSDYDITSVLDLHRLISPTGDRMALVISNDQGLDLVLIKIPAVKRKQSLT